MQTELLEAFYNIIPETKIELFERIAPERTRYLTVVMENIYQEHNASAVMRSCESLGIQEFHVIESKNKYKAQRDIARGAGSWIEMNNYTEGEKPVIGCLKQLKERGYQLAILTPDAPENTIFNTSLDQPIALIFGTEWEGISQEARDMADVSVAIPMVGFTESFNVSVSVALVLQALRHRLETQDAIDWKLNPEEQLKVKLDWCAKIVKNGEKVREELLRRINAGVE